jgi:FlaA1/EpsC-like NDP-sugar epimerase/UDP-N-acetylmuramyl pentapeptide phosphotransferase/UDP-N-acetylglucosamine-1-phosphate transferase
MISPPSMVSFLVVTAAVTFVTAAVLLKFLRGTTGVLALDVPNARSSHSNATPRGGGVVMVVAVTVGMLAGAIAFPAWRPLALSFLPAALVIAGVSFIDDRRPLPTWLRFAVHVGSALALVAMTGIWRQIELPWAAILPLGGVLASVITVLWIVGLSNAYNFMDGIDGIAGLQAVFAGMAWAAAGIALDSLPIAVMGVLISSSAAGFLLHNWSPARIFMGDVGAVFLGFTFAALPLLAAPADPRAPIFAALVVWPFIVDSAFTLARRTLRGEPIFAAHRQHVYQRLVETGLSHGQVATTYGLFSLIGSLLGAAYWVNPQGSAIAVVAGLPLMMLGLIVVLSWRERRLLRAPDEADVPIPSGRHPLRNRYVLVADIAAIGFSAFAAFVLRFDWLFVQYRDEFFPFLTIALITKPLIFGAFGLYQRYWRYATIWDMLALIVAASASSAVITILMGLVNLAGDTISGFPRLVIPIDWLLTVVCCGGIRLSVKIIAETQSVRIRQAQGTLQKRVLVAGAGDAGIMVVREMQRNPHLGMLPVGFLDDDPAKTGKKIHGVTVLGGLRMLPAVARECAPDEIVIALPRAAGTTVRRVADSARAAGLPSRAMPGMFELLDGNVSVSRLRQIEISDLLRRPQVVWGTESAAYLAGRTVLVTGAGGSIGSELCRQIAHAGPALLVMVGHGENSIYDMTQQLRTSYPQQNCRAVIADIRDATRLRMLFSEIRPSIVFHAAAHKHVPLMEDNPEEAVTNNVVGTANVIDAAVAAGTERLVMISTDKAVSPTSVMGASKRIAERLVCEAALRHRRAFVTVRFGNVLGSRGSVVPFFKKQIEMGGPITITHPDMKRFFMTIPEAVHLVLQAGGMGTGGELFVLNMGRPVRILDLARDLITLSGLAPDEIEIVYTGLRPGEKLEESLWDQNATIQPTDHTDVWLVKEPDLEPQAPLPAIVERLKQHASVGDALSIQLELARAIPSFAPAIDSVDRVL